MPFSLLRYALFGDPPGARHLPPRPELKPSYDVVVVGGGGHGLAIAYYLAKSHGIRSVAVLEKGYIGGGNTARNTTVIRSNYISAEAVRFYKASVEMFRQLSAELDYNLMFSERGQLTLAHTDASTRTFRQRAEVNKHLGVRSEMIGLDEIARLVPDLNLSRDVRFPILGGLWHEDGATARHDAVAWAYARRAAELGVEIHQRTEVTGLEIAGGAIRAVVTSRGRIECGAAVQAVAGSTSRVAAMAGLRLPIVTYPLQAMVTEPLKPFMNPLVSSAQLHCYLSQTARGEVVIGGGSDPYPLYSTRSTLDMKESLVMHAIEMFPALAQARLLRQWAGITDMTPDYSPVMGLTPVERYYLDGGWGTWGFKATPISGRTMAETVATGTPPDMIGCFSLDRFDRLDLMNEMGATAASH